MFTRFLRSGGCAAAIVLIVSTPGCASPSTPKPVMAPTSAASCFPQSVFTADDMRARVDCHPDAYKLEIEQGTVVLFAFPDPLLDWAGPIFIIHIPSVSEAVLDKNGSVLFEGYKSQEGRQAIENVLNDRGLIADILQRAKEIQ